MTCPEENAASEWASSDRRITWAENNYRRYPREWQLRRFMILFMNLIAMGNVLEQETGESLLSYQEKKKWREMYEVFQPNSSSEPGPTA